MAHSTLTRLAMPEASAAGAKSTIVLAAVAAIGLGLLLLAGAGFAAPEVLHNAAHDSRHAFAFPCH